MVGDDVEVGQIRRIFAENGPVESVLGVDAGSGRHLELLAAAGYQTGEAAADRIFDAAIMMSGRFGRLVANERLLETLASVHQGLRPGGVFAFDVIDAASVLGSTAPRGKVTTTSDGAGRQTLAGSRITVNDAEQVVRVERWTWRLDGDRLVDESETIDEIRYFLPRELRLLLARAGFELTGYQPLGDDLWRRLVSGRKPRGGRR